MKQANNLLYGRRAPSKSQEKILLRRAEMRLRDGYLDEALDYFTTYPGDVGPRQEAMLETIIFNYVRDETERYPDELILRPSLNDPAITPDPSEAASLAACLKRGNFEDAAGLADSLLKIDRPGRVLFNAISKSGLDSQIALYLRIGDAPLGRLVHRNLAARLLAEAERPSRGLAYALDLVSDESEQVGFAAGQLHLFGADGCAACSHNLHPDPVERGLWRDNLHSRCSNCIVLGQSPDLGSDDPRNFTLLSEPDYEQGLRDMAAMLFEQRSYFVGLGQDNIEEMQDLIIDKMEGYSFKIRELHKQRIATLFTDQFNRPAGKLRRFHCNQARAWTDANLDERDVLSWLDGWLEQSGWLTIKEIVCQFEDNLNFWIDKNRATS